MRLNGRAAGVPDIVGFDRGAALQRPSLGPLPSAAVAAIAAACATEELSWRTFAEDPAPALPICASMLLAGALCACVALFRARRGGKAGRRVSPGRVARLLAVPALAFTCVGVCAWLSWGAWPHDMSALAAACASGEVELEVTGDAVERDYGTVSTACWHCGGHTVALRVKWPDGSVPVTPGHLARVRGHLVEPGDDEAGRWNHRNGYVGMLSASAAAAAGRAGGLGGLVADFRDDSFSRIAELGGEQAAVLAGVLLGNRTLYAGTELEQAFRTTGLAHLMAVSGTHLAVVSALLGWVLERSRARRGLRLVLLAGALACYSVLTGLAPSALRACSMCVVGLSAGMFARRRHVLSSLSLCVVVFLSLSPPLAFSLGFQLSVLAVFGLVLLSPLFAAWLRCLLPQRAGGLCDAFAATLAATATTIPITVPLFVQLPLITPVATVLAAPVITLALGLGVVALVAAAPLTPLSSVLLHCAGALSGACAWLVHMLARVPGACIPLDGDAAVLGVATALALAALWAWWPDPARFTTCERRRIGVAAVLLAVLLPVGGLGGVQGSAGALLGFPSPAQVIMLDVGQGDAMLVRDGSAAVLVDTGEDGDVLKRDLARHGVARLDAVYITHKDADHCGALGSLSGVVDVGHVFVHADLLSYEGERAVLEAARQVTGGAGAEGVRPGSRARAGSFSITVLAPYDGGTSENEDSLVSLLEYDADGDGCAEARGLLTGDAESDALAELCPQVGDVDFVKVGHHGSAGAFTADQLEQLAPRFALIGVGLGNSYGHPTAETLGLLERAGAAVYRTDLDGDIVVSFSKERIGVTVQKGR